MFKPLDPSYRLEGEIVYLRPITGRDTYMVLSWRNSDYVRNNFFYRKTVSVDDHEKWLADKVAQGLVFQFIVCMKDDDTPVGSVYLQHYDEETGEMESGLFFDEKAPHGRGIATEAYRLMTDEFARELGLKSLFARIIADNRASIRIHENCGFQTLGQCTQAVIPTGEEIPAVNMRKELN